MYTNEYLYADKYNLMPQRMFDYLNYEYVNSISGTK